MTGTVTHRNNGFRNNENPFVMDKFKKESSPFEVANFFELYVDKRGYRPMANKIGLSFYSRYCRVSSL